MLTKDGRYIPAGHNKEKSKGKAWLAAHVNHRGDDCLIWPFAKTRGYGCFKCDGEAWYAHRYMCVLVHGEPPSPLHQAAHSCGNGHLACVHPEHVSWKSPEENQQDRQEHGTQKRGYGPHGRATSEQRAAMLALKGKKTHDEIAKMFGFTRQNVSAILAGKTFRDDSKMPPPLTPEQIAVIRQVGYSMSAGELASMLGVSRSVVDRVRTGQTYRKVPMSAE